MQLSRKKVLFLQPRDESKDEAKEFTIDFPNTGKMLDIELMKVQLSDGKYDTLKYSFNTVFQQQAVRIEAIATFITLIPDLKEQLNVKSMLHLEYEDMALIESMYVEQFLPWYEEWMTLLSKPKEKSKDV
jgi:hypothetical protein